MASEFANIVLPQSPAVQLTYGTTAARMLVAVQTYSAPLGSPQWHVEPCEGVQVSSRDFATDPNILGIQAARVYELQCSDPGPMSRTQRLALINSTVTPPAALLETVDVTFTSHPIMNTSFITARTPVGDQMPLLVAVSDNSASTGFVWETRNVMNCEVASQFFAPESPIVGAPGTRIFCARVNRFSLVASLTLDLIRPGDNALPAQEIKVTIHPYLIGQKGERN